MGYVYEQISHHSMEQMYCITGDWIGIDRVALGAVEDTLKACLARIPKNGSIGQRMVAEASCERDEMERRPIETVPGADYASQ